MAFVIQNIWRRKQIERRGYTYSFKKKKFLPSKKIFFSPNHEIPNPWGGEPLLIVPKILTQQIILHS